MNCQDIADILDDGNVARLDLAQRRDIEAHLAGCADCARDWRLHGAFAALPDMQVPAGFAGRCRAAVAAAGNQAMSRRARSRFILIGTLAAVAAAAAMLLLSLRDPPAVAVAATIAVAEPAAPPPALPVAEEAEPVESSTAPAPPPVATATGEYSVLILPLESQTEDPAVIAAVRQLQQKMVESLRTLPGVTVLESHGPGLKEPEYALVVAAQDPTASDPAGSGRYRVTTYEPRSTRTKEQLAALERNPESLRKQAIRQDAFPGFAPTVSYSGIVFTAEACQGRSCPSEAAKYALRLLRLSAFRHDMAIQREVVARLLDPGLEPAMRQDAISDLNALIGTGRAPGLDAELVRGLLDLHSGTADPQWRAELWNSLVRWKDPGLIAPIAELARTESDEQVRATLVTRLAGNFGSEAAARNALQEIAATDSSQLVRQVARRTLLGETGEADWHQYVLDTLRDRELGAQQRFEPIRFLLSQTGVDVKDGTSLPVRTLDRLDADAIGALAEVLPAAWSDDDPNALDTLAIQMLFVRLKHPALADLLLKGVESGKPIAKASLPGFLERYMDEPRVVKALEKLRGDSDARVSEAARKVLAKRESATASAAQ